MFLTLSVITVSLDTFSFCLVSVDFYVRVAVYYIVPACLFCSNIEYHTDLPGTCFTRTTCMCVLWRDNFKENKENCHDFIVLYCVRNWEGISVVENLVRHNNRSFHKLVIVTPITSKKTNNNHCQKDRGYFPLG